MTTKFRSRLTLDHLDERALPSAVLPLSNTHSSATAGSADPAVATAVATPSGSINFRSDRPVSSGTIHITVQGLPDYDLPFTVANNETPEQTATRLAEALRRDGFSVVVTGSELTVYTQNAQPVTGIGGGFTGTNGQTSTPTPGTTGDVNRYEPVRDDAGKITGWKVVRPTAE